MAYEIHIKRGTPITMAEWKSAIEGTEGVRLFSGTHSLVNPKTGQSISVQAVEGDTEILIEGTWRPGFRWFEGSISLKAAAAFETYTDHKLRPVVRELATKLGAEVRGDEGEEY
jgi:hypothetical protein